MKIIGLDPFYTKNDKILSNLILKLKKIYLIINCVQSLFFWIYKKGTSITINETSLDIILFKDLYVYIFNTLRGRVKKKRVEDLLKYIFNFLYLIY